MLYSLIFVIFLFKETLNELIARKAINFVDFYSSNQIWKA